MKKNLTATSPLEISRITISSARVRTGVQAGTLFPPPGLHVLTSTCATLK